MNVNQQTKNDTLESDIQAFKDHFHCKEYEYNRKPGLLFGRIEKCVGEPARSKVFSNHQSWITDDCQLIETFSSRRSAPNIVNYKPFLNFAYEESTRGNKVIVYSSAEYNVFFDDAHEIDEIRKDFKCLRGHNYSTIVILIRKR